MSLEGGKQLADKLARLGKAGQKALRRGTLKATTPVVRQMRQKAPKGDEPHKTYKGRTVSGGFLKRSIRRRSRARGGKVSVVIGVRSEAFYGVAFLDKGITVKSRKAKKGGLSNTFKVGKRGGGSLFNRRANRIKPYTIEGRNWFEDTFVANQNNMTTDLIKEVRKELDKVL